MLQHTHTHTHLIWGQVYTQMCHLFSRAHSTSFLSRHKVLKSLGRRKSSIYKLQDLPLTITYSRIRTCSGSAWAWILPLSDGVSTVPGKRILIYHHISITDWWAASTVGFTSKTQRQNPFQSYTFCFPNLISSYADANNSSKTRSLKFKNPSEHRGCQMQQKWKHWKSRKEEEEYSNSSNTHSASVSPQKCCETGELLKLCCRALVTHQDKCNYIECLAQWNLQQLIWWSQSLQPWRYYRHTGSQRLRKTHTNPSKRITMVILQQLKGLLIKASFLSCCHLLKRSQVGSFTFYAWCNRCHVDNVSWLLCQHLKKTNPNETGSWCEGT